MTRAPVASTERGQSAEGVGDAGLRIRGVGLKGVAASAELVLAFKLGGIDAIFDVELANVAPVRGDEGFEQCVLFDVARGV